MKTNLFFDMEITSELLIGIIVLTILVIAGIILLAKKYLRDREK